MVNNGMGNGRQIAGPLSGRPLRGEIAHPCARATLRPDAEAKSQDLGARSGRNRSEIPPAPGHRGQNVIQNKGC